MPPAVPVDDAATSAAPAARNFWVRQLLTCAPKSHAVLCRW